MVSSFLGAANRWHVKASGLGASSSPSAAEVQLAAVPISPTRPLLRRTGARATSSRWWLLSSSPRALAARARGGGSDLVVANGFSAGCGGEILLGFACDVGGVVPPPRAGLLPGLRLWSCPR